jgi:hypothetical protein
MLQMRDKRRPYLDQQRFEFGVLGIGNQGSVDGIQDALMICDFMAHIRTVERTAVELFHWLAVTTIFAICGSVGPAPCAQAPAASAMTPVIAAQIVFILISSLS